MSRLFGIWNFKISGNQLLAACNELNSAEESLIAISNPAGRLDIHSFQNLNPAAHYETGLMYTGKDFKNSFFQNSDIAVVIAGQIANMPQLIAHFNEGAAVSPAQMIALLYQKFGTSVFENTNGGWAIAIADFKNQKLILARDRFGVKPLLYISRKGEFAFASIAKPLLALPDVKPTWSKDKFLQFVVYGATTNPHETFFDAIKTVKPGHFLEYSFSNGAVGQQPYYNLRERVATKQDRNQSFEELFERSVHNALETSQPLGALLSGGLDSSAIVAQTANRLPHLDTFTCSFPQLPIDESQYARMLSAKNNSLRQHFTTPTAQDFFDHFDEVIQIQERPIGSASIFTQWWVMRAASQEGVEVLLDGQGADEVFGGYYPFAGSYLISLLKAARFQAFQNELKALQENFNPQMFQAMLRSAFYLLPRQLQFLARQKNRVGYELIAKKYQKRAAQQPAPLRGGGDFRELTFKSIEFGLYELLQYADKNASANGIETRLPFLDYQLVEWAVNLPDDQKMNNGWTKLPIRKYLAKKGFENLAWRKDKLGFVAPQDLWRREVGDMFLKKIQSLPITDLLNQKKINSLFKESLQNSAAQTAFWRIVALLRWMDIFKIELVDSED